MNVKGYIDGTAYEEHIIERNGKQDCPVCIQVGKQNHKDKPLSVNLQNKVFKCHRCAWSGGWGEAKKDYSMDVTYEKPDIGNQTDLYDDHLIHFSKRLITQDVLIRNKVKSSSRNKAWFAFTYFDGETPVKWKAKTKDKKMMQSKNSMPWIFKYNDLIGQKEVMICEGEEEALIWEVAGFKHACSVDMGAPNVNDSSADAKLKCIENCFDVFENAETIYIAVDNDPNGERLKKELIRRFKAEKCKIIDFSPFKDANEYAIRKGIDELNKLKQGAQDVQIEGVFKAKDLEKDILHDYFNGQSKGTTTYFGAVDALWTWRLGEVNVWTGYNNEGKSLFLKQLQIVKSIGDGWNHAVFSPEEFPLNEWYTDLMESYIGKSMDKTQAQYNNYANKIEVNEALFFVNNHFINVYPKESHTLDEILDKFSYTVRKYNCKTVTFDPYNQIHHKMENGEREDLYISRFMSRLKRFAIEHMVSVNLVAHQKTPFVERDKNYPEPNLFNIKGGGTFADKADNILAIWRENRNTDKKCTLVKFISQKIKKQKLTGIPGTANLDFDRRKNRYSDVSGVYPIQRLKYDIEQNLQQEFPEMIEENKKQLKDFHYEYAVLKGKEVPF